MDLVGLTGAEREGAGPATPGGLAEPPPPVRRAEADPGSGLPSGQLVVWSDSGSLHPERAQK
eukprot:385664-Alexandrium_andersonii.AAC.1